MTHKNSPTKLRNLRRINHLLTLVIILINLYIIALPLIPRVSFWWKKHNDKTNGIPYVGSLNSNDTKSEQIKRAPIPDDNRIVIPALALNEKIYEGTSQYTVNKGVWLRPNTSAPDSGGNTVLVGHRFTYKDPAVFYHLDKVKIGDRLAVYWNKVEYLYEVKEVKIVPATAIEIEQQTQEDILTIYTCTPLWTAKDRLVVIAKPLEIKNKELSNDKNN